MASDAADFARILAWLDELAALNQQRGLAATPAIRGIVPQILALACARHEAPLRAQAARHGGRSSRRDVLQRVMRYVREHLHDEEMSLQDAAAAAMLSPNYLAHLLKKQTDRTFTERVTERRLEQAKELLLGSGASIGAVAQQCGFRDAAYFARRFRQHAGLTPRAFREKNRL